MTSLLVYKICQIINPKATCIQGYQKIEAGTLIDLVK